MDNNTKDDPLDRPGAKRAAYSHLQHLYGSMSRPERLAVCACLIYASLPMDLLRVEPGINGSATFKGKIEDIQVLAPNLSTMILIELAMDILNQELKAIQ